MQDSTVYTIAAMHVLKAIIIINLHYYYAETADTTLIRRGKMELACFLWYSKTSLDPRWYSKIFLSPYVDLYCFTVILLYGIKSSCYSGVLYEVADGSILLNILQLLVALCVGGAGYDRVGTTANSSLLNTLAHNVMLNFRTLH